MKQDSPESKFKDPELLRRAREPSPEEVTILVELDLPSRQIEVEKGEHRGVQVALPKRVAPYTPEEQEEIVQQREAARTFLSELVEAEPRWLQSARAFVVTAPESQLASIAEFPLIKAIHPNRSLKQ